MVKFKSLRKASDRGLESARSRVTIFLSLVFGLWGKMSLVIHIIYHYY